jgi:hypothetical protein
MRVRPGRDSDLNGVHYVRRVMFPETGHGVRGYSTTQAMKDTPPQRSKASATLVEGWCTV